MHYMCNKIEGLIKMLAHLETERSYNLLRNSLQLPSALQICRLYNFRLTDPLPEMIQPGDCTESRITFPDNLTELQTSSRLQLWRLSRIINY